MMLSNSNGVLSGHVFADGAAWANAQVTLYEAGQVSATVLSTAQTDQTGQYQFQFSPPDNGATLYVLASTGDPATSQVVLASVAGEAGVNLQQTADVNELTTVATGYALSQFIHGEQIFGPSPGLPNAVSTFFTLVDVETGAPAEVVSNFNNGTTLAQNSRSTLALQTMNTLADMVAACASDPAANCSTLFALATPPGGVAPTNTIGAIQDINQHPVSLDNNALFALSQMNTTYEPALSEAPDGWLLALHFTDGGFSGPGRIAFDTAGNVWSNNNFQLNPPDTSNPMGIAIDQQGNIWIPNSGATGDESQFGSLTVYLHGDPKQAITLKDESLIKKPFAIAIDDQGRAWIANSGPTGGSVMVMKIVNGHFSEVTKTPITSPGLSQAPDDLTALPYSDYFVPRTIAIDAFGNAWVNNIAAKKNMMVSQEPDGSFKATDVSLDGLIAGWGLAVDSSNTVYVVSNPVFAHQTPTDQIIMVDASDPANPVQIGKFTNPAMQITTAVQIDQSGNVWTVNNWSLESQPHNIFGGDGLIKFIGLASPTAAPLIGSPTLPAAQATSPISDTNFKLSEDVYVVGTGAVSVTPARGVLANDTSPSALTVTSGTVAGANGGTEEAFVDGLYHSIFGRDPDPQGKQYWLDYLAAVGNSTAARSQAAYAILNSREAYQGVIAGWFEKYLQRSPTEIELNVYVQDMLGGSSDRDLEQAITNLAEYRQTPSAAPPGAGVRLPDFLTL